MAWSTPFRALATAVLATALAHGQEVEPEVATENPIRGTIIGFDGQPGAFATVRVFGAGGRRLGEIVAGSRGRFEHRAALAPTRIEVQIEGVIRAVPLAGRDLTAIGVTFEDAPHYTLRGQLLDPAGQGLTRTDLLVRDRFDRTVVNVTTNDRGEFTVRLADAVRSIVVDPLGLDWVQEFETAVSRDLLIDLRYVDGDFFSIDGRVLDTAGAPVPGALVRAGSSNRVRVQRTARADGSFVLWSRRPLEYLIAIHAGRPIACHFAIFDRTSSVELDAVAHGYIEIEGRVVNPLGQPVSEARIYGGDADDRPLLGLQMLALSGPDGTFTARVPRELPRLIGLSDVGSGTSGWQPDRPVELVVR